MHQWRDVTFMVEIFSISRHMFNVSFLFFSTRLRALLSSYEYSDAHKDNVSNMNLAYYSIASTDAAHERRCCLLSGATSSSSRQQRGRPRLSARGLGARVLWQKNVLRLANLLICLINGKSGGPAVSVAIRPWPAQGQHTLLWE